jgi:hypothetical protein
LNLTDSLVFTDRMELAIVNVVIFKIFFISSTHAQCSHHYHCCGWSNIIFGAYTLKEYSLSFTICTLFYSIVFLNSSRSSYSKFILYINYHPYFNIFYTTNFFSLIPISTTIHFYIYIKLSYKFIIYYFILIYIIINIICKSLIIYFFIFFFPFFFPFLFHLPSYLLSGSFSPHPRYYLSLSLTLSPSDGGRAWRWGGGGHGVAHSDAGRSGDAGDERREANSRQLRGAGLEHPWRREHNGRQACGIHGGARLRCPLLVRRQLLRL